MALLDLSGIPTLLPHGNMLRREYHSLRARIPGVGLLSARHAAQLLAQIWLRRPERTVEADVALILRLSGHPSVAIRRETTRLVLDLARRSPELALALLGRLACDSAVTVRRSAAACMGLWLRGAPGIERTWLISEWASSDHMALRLAVARVLRRIPLAVGARLALDALAHDPVNAVRRAALPPEQRVAEQRISEPTSTIRVLRTATPALVTG